MRLRHLLFTATLFLCLSGASQTPKQIRNRLGSFFEHYQNPAVLSYDRIRVEDMRIEPETKHISIHLNEGFLVQPFTAPLVEDIYAKVRTLLPSQYSGWELSILAQGTPIQQLIPALPGDTLRTWHGTDYTGPAWVTPLSHPNKVTHGLAGRHIALWASHGNYYRNQSDTWTWQRPQLFTTCEDLFTQTIVVPMLMPMLERAGAVLFSPRERDWQKNEVIVERGTEQTGHYEWETVGPGFAKVREVYTDGQNPFLDGITRMVPAQHDKSRPSSTTWTPDIPEDGEYAVYVSYKTLPGSVPDAVYEIRHKGISTKVQVNQQMGGDTWVYLGTYAFSRGQNPESCVILTNVSAHHGTVTAGAVRFGGGMGNIARGDSLNPHPAISYMPRYLEGARYSMQWAGLPYSIYSTKESQNDYGDDINTRPLSTNHVARGSVFMPNDTLPGLKVPIEMSIALHSDAGYRKNEDIVGSLGIYTTGFYDGVLATGLSRLTSRDLADRVLTQVAEDMRNTFGTWSRRQMYDRNYSESREPQVPSIILEMLSHQNWADMRIGLDPYGRFILARAIYKGILHHMAVMHGWSKTVTQPLPIEQLQAIADPSSHSIHLRWQPQTDKHDATATPTGYILYTRRGQQDWDNGTYIEGTHTTVKATPGTFYRFRVAAANSGGTSLPSQELCARIGSNRSDAVLIVNGFNRVASAECFDNDTCRGFDMSIDPGVPYLRDPGFCGPQLCYNKSGYGKEGFGGLGYSTSQYTGMLVAGNTFNYPSQHALDMLLADSNTTAGRDLTISSCSEGMMPYLSGVDFSMVDLILGAQRRDGYSHRPYPCFTPEMQQQLTMYQKTGGAILVSGAYIGEDLQSQMDRDFAQDVLHLSYGGHVHTDSLTLRGMGTELTLYNKPNTASYSTARINALLPGEGAFCTMLSQRLGETLRQEHNLSVAVASQQGARTLTYGFPLEMITDPEKRRAIINASYLFLCTK